MQPCHAGVDYQSVIIRGVKRRLPLQRTMEDGADWRPVTEGFLPEMLMFTIITSLPISHTFSALILLKFNRLMI